MNYIVTLLLRVNGDVQGVGFRNYIYNQASSRSVTGWIRNCSDGSVEVLVQGNPTDVGSVEAACHSGPPGANVTEVKGYPVDSDTRYDAFEVHQ